MIGKNEFHLNQETMCLIVEDWFSRKIIGNTGVVKEVKGENYYSDKKFIVTIHYPGGAPPEGEDHAKSE